MPASDISRLSTKGNPQSDLAASMAREVANKEIRSRIDRKLLKRDDDQSIRREWKDIYRQEYYKYYAMLIQQNQRNEKIIYLPTANPSANKFLCKHAIAGFNRTNIFIHVRDRSVIAGRVNYPLDEDISLETKEAYLTGWPGPLDRPDEHLRQKTIDYIDTLSQHDPHRRIKYTGDNDEQRGVILKLLTELLHRNGSIDAFRITRLLLKPELTDIQKDEGYRRPLETLQKYLLQGKRNEAIKYAKGRKLWDHAQCLSFLDKYQPPNTCNYVRDRARLKDDTIVQLNDEYINSIDPGILNTVYRSLLNRILQSDPESVNIIKRPNVGGNNYDYAMLSANDCEMDFDQSNEMFNLIQALKQANQQPSMADSHLISLGFTTIENNDHCDSLSNMSNLSFGPTDTQAGRALIISNIDMLIINEIWEYCLNLARGSADPSNYDYIVNLIPYKLIFASKLLDFGLHSMFKCYLESIKNSIARMRSDPSYQIRDQYYDWDTIETSVEYISRVWEVVQVSFDPQNYPDMTNPSQSLIMSPVSSGSNQRVQPFTPKVPSFEIQQNIPAGYAAPPAPANFSHQDSFQQRQHQQQHQPIPSAYQYNSSAYQQQHHNAMQPTPPAISAQEQSHRNDHIDSAIKQDYRSLLHPIDSNSLANQQIPSQISRIPSYNIPAGFANQQPAIPEEVNDFNPEPEPMSEIQDNEHGNQQSSNSYNDYSTEPSRRTSLDVPPFSPNLYNQQIPPPVPPLISAERGSMDGGKQMSSSSPVNRSREGTGGAQSSMADSFNAFSPINEYDDLPRRNFTNESQNQRFKGTQPPFASNPASPPDFARVNSSAPRSFTESSDNVQNKQPHSSGASSDGQQASSSAGDPARAGFIANLAGSVRGLLPKSNSKQMILPDDSSKTIVYDDERKTWIDTTKDQDEQVDDFSEPPPVVPPARQNVSYSLGLKSTKNRYPRV